MAENKLEIDLLINDKEAIAKLKAALGDIGKQSKDSTDSMNLGWAGFASQLFVVQQAIAPVIDFMKEAVEAANEQEDALARLNTALKLQGTFTSQLAKSYEDMATSLSKNSRFADEQITATMQKLVTLGNVGPQQMERVTKATLDFATALRIDLNQASLLVAKAAVGETGALSRYGLVIDDNIPKAQKFEAVLKMIADRMGGSAQADLETFAGKQSQLGKAWNEVMEEIGGFVTQSPAVIQGMEDLAKFAGDLAAHLKEIRENNPNLLADVWDAVTNLSPLKWGARLAGAVAGGANTPQTLAEAILGNEEQNAQKVVDLGSIVVTAARSQQDIWLSEQEAKEAAAREKYIQGEVEKIDQLRLIWDQWNNEKTAGAMAAIQAETDFLQLAIQTQQLAHQSMWKTIGKERDAFQAGVAGMFKDMVRGTFNSKEAFKELGLTMLDILIDYGVQLAINMALSKAFSAAQVGISTATASIVAAAWAPAAAAASLATLGNNAAPAAAALTTTHALSRALSAIPGAFEGGDVTNPGAVLVGERGPEILNLPTGARITPLDRAGSGGGDTHINIEINNPIMTTEEATRNIARQIAREVSEFIDLEKERL